MSKVKFVILNSIVFILIGSALVSFAIEFAWMLVSGDTYLPVDRLVFNFFVGLFISTTIVLLHLLIMRFKKRPLVGYLISVVAIMLTLFAVYLYTGLVDNIWTLDAKWLVIFIVVESFSLILIAYWYRMNNLYNNKLDLKKAALRASKNREEM